MLQAHGMLSLLLAGPLGTYLQAVVVRAVLECIPHDALLSRTPSLLGKNRLVLSQYEPEDEMVRCPAYRIRTAVVAFARSICHTRSLCGTLPHIKHIAGVALMWHTPLKRSSCW